jgi:glucose dehydrogenase
MASSKSEIAADVCILGSGIAGMLLAERLLQRSPRRSIVIVERGTKLTHGERLEQGSHKDPLPFNRSPLQLRHPPPPTEFRSAWDQRYSFPAVYNLGGCTNVYFGNMPRFHPSHFDGEAYGGASRRWPIRYAELEPYYLEAERRLHVSGNSQRPPFEGKFDYPLPPHRLSPSDRACQVLFGEKSVTQVPTTRASRPVDRRPACCGTDRCELCPVDAKITALNTVFPAIKDRIPVHAGLLVTELHCRGGRVVSATAVDAQGATHRIKARQFVVACNGVDSCLLLQRSPTVPQLPALGRYYMDQPAFELTIYDSGVETKPGYADSAETGMLVPFFERVDGRLPVSVLGEIRPGSFAVPMGSPTRDRLVRDVIRRALESRQDGDFRTRFKTVFGGSVDLLFMIEAQPRVDHTIGIDRIASSGQAIPALQLQYPTYFAECVQHIRGWLERRAPKALIKYVNTFPTSYHWLGATRMSTTDADGCVDANLRYHGLENLHILSTSVYTSSSSANPTLTLAALSLRLGHHLSGGPDERQAGDDPVGRG